VRNRLIPSGILEMQRHGVLWDQRSGLKFGIVNCTGGDCAEKHVENDDTDQIQVVLF